jgi:phage repressor protein C with HTH and peptisase S24 domain
MQAAGLITHVKSIAERVKWARNERGLTQAQLAKAARVAQGTIGNLESGARERPRELLAIAQALAVNPEWIESGKGPIWQASGFDIPASARTPGEPLPSGHKASERVAKYSGMAPIYAWEHDDELPPGEYVMVPRLDVHLSAGGGRDQVEIEFTKQAPQAFRADWIREQRFKPKKLAAMTASGESMEPAIHHGDSLLVDTSQTEVVDGRVYALWYEGGERVKRLFRLPGGGLRIKSDNSEHGTIELGPDYIGHVRIIGRVVHRSGRGGL